MEDHTRGIFAASGLKKMQWQIEMLRRDLGASGAMLLDDTGHLIVECGKHGDYDVDTFLAMLGNAMSASNAVIHMLRDKSAFDLHIHEGASYEMYTSRINDQIFLTLTLDKRAGSSRVGMVWIALRRAVSELRELIEQAEVKPGTTEDQEIQNAISGTLTEALERFESNVLTSSSVESTTPATSPHNEADSPDITPEDLIDPDHTISYEQARRLGLINLDNADRDGG